MRNVHFDPADWEDFLFRLSADRKTARRITRLIGEIQREVKILKARYHY
ncbi:hypothetical protein [Streptomyces sp. NPDC058548]